MPASLDLPAPLPPLLRSTGTFREHRPVPIITRRDIFNAAAGAGLATVAATPTFAFAIDDQSPQPPSGPTPAPLAGKELPSFRFALGEKPENKFDGGWAKEATVA